MTYLAAFTILVLTVGISLGRPKIGRWRIQHPSAAIGGAMATLVLGLVPLDLAAQMLIQLAPSIVTIISLMIITLVTERSGLLHRMALGMARIAKGDARRLFLYLFALGTTTGVFFTNDATILIFTPLVFALIEEVQEPGWTLASKIPFYFAVLYMGNLVGALVISNPINIIVSSFFDITFAEYAAWMVLPAIASMVVSFVGLRIFFRKDLPRRYAVPQHDGRNIGDPRLIPICAIVLSLTLLGFFTGSFTGIPVWLVASLGAAMLLVSAHRHDHPAQAVIRGVGWDVIIFVMGIFIVVLGLRNAGLTEHISSFLQVFEQYGDSGMMLGTGFTAAICSALLNNHPTAGLMIWVIQDWGLEPGQTKMMVFSALIGGDLGPKMLPIGSLAALMWFRMLRARGVDVPYTLYIKVGVPVTLTAVLVSILVLNLEWRLFGGG